jgi:predicted aspartyl protease
MSLTHRSNRLFALLTVAVCLPALAPAQSQTEPARPITTAKIKVDELAMIIVPVSIDGSAPYDFLLDTGASKTMVDQKLADQLALPRITEKTVSGMLGSAKMSVVHIDSLSVAGASVAAGEIFSSDHVPTVTAKVRGVLGEDFLQNFDLLIDYRHQSIQLQSPLSSMAATVAGERLPLQLTGELHGRPTTGRLVVSGHIPELGDKPMSLLLDSGANSLVLFQDSLGPGAAREQSLQAGSFNKWISSSAATRSIRVLSLGRNSVENLTVVALDRRAEVDTDGLVPTSLFHSVFISPRGGFAILNPSFANSTNSKTNR